MNYHSDDLTRDELIAYLQAFHGRYADSYYENQPYEELLKLYTELLDRGGFL